MDLEQLYLKSNKLYQSKNKNLIDNNINLFCQFFINKNIERQKEIEYVLQKNVDNKFVNNIYLLNEKIYTDKELGIKSDKIKQINIGKRLKYNDTFNFIKNNNIKGYNIIINSDIFFDNSIEKLLYSNLHDTKTMCCLLRYELNTNDINKSELHKGLYPSSQDTWIIHSNNQLTDKEINNFDFNFGVPGCDNAIVYIFHKLNFEVINDPFSIKSYHYHTSNDRTYDTSQRVVMSYADIMPYYEIQDKKIEGFKSIENKKNYLNLIMLIILIIMVI